MPYTREWLAWIQSSAELTQRCLASLRVCFWTCFFGRLAAGISPEDVVFRARCSALLRSARSRSYSMSIANASLRSSVFRMSARVRNIVCKLFVLVTSDTAVIPKISELLQICAVPPEFLWTSTDSLDDFICRQMVTAEDHCVNEPRRSCQQGG